MTIREPGLYRLLSPLHTHSATSTGVLTSGVILQITQVDTAGQKVIGSPLLDWTGWEIDAEPVDDPPLDPDTIHPPGPALTPIREASQPEIDRLTRERDEARAGVEELVRDRDEWREQHENLLAMYRAAEAREAELRRALEKLSTAVIEAEDLAISVNMRVPVEFAVEFANVGGAALACRGWLAALGRHARGGKQ